MKFSIIIPTHNRPDILPKVIDSFKNLKDSEIIVVENNSTEANKEKLQDYKSVAPANVSILSIDGINLPQARFIGIEKAKGKYVFHVDDDDAATEEFINYLNSNNFDKPIYRFPYNRTKKLILNPSIGSSIKRNSWFKTVEVSTYLIKRDIIKKEWYDINFMNMEDQWSGYHMMAYKQEFVNIPSIDYNAFFIENSMTRGKRNASDFKVLKSTYKLDDKNLFLIKALRLFDQTKKRYEKGIFENETKESFKQMHWEKGLPIDYKFWFVWKTITGKRK